MTNGYMMLCYMCEHLRLKKCRKKKYKSKKRLEESIKGEKEKLQQKLGNERGIRLKKSGGR